jgi:AraC-like DNA-binding protein
VGAPIVDTAVDFPARALRPFINQYAGFRVSGKPPSLHFGLPSSNVNLIISLSGPIDLVQMPNSVQRPSLLTALLSGLHDVPAIVRQSSDTFGIHVFIKPLGVRAILGVGSAEISSRVVNLADIWGQRAEDLIGMLRASDTWRKRFQILDRTFASTLVSTGWQSEISWAWNRLAKTHGALPIQQLADEIGYSRRHFSERFRDATGLAPKSASRVFRFERACRFLMCRHIGLAEVAAACGYYDQAHLTREWYALAGCSPKAWIARDLPFLQDYEIAGHDNAPDGHQSVHHSFVRRPA